MKFRAYGRSLAEALENCGRAFLSATAGESVVEKMEERETVLVAPDLERLVHDWLSELIFLFSTERMLFSGFDLTVDGKYRLKARLRGEKFNPKKHKLYKEIKAATYHDMKIEEKDGKWNIEVVCDT